MRPNRNDRNLENAVARGGIAAGVLLAILALVGSGHAQPAAGDRNDETAAGGGPASRAYEVDPVLRKAFEAYNDEQRPREEAIKLFEKHLAENPTTPFRAEIYFRIGALYSIHRRVSLGETREIGKACDYYRMARELYGDRFSYLNHNAFGSLANRPEAPLAFRKRYYEWLMRLAKEGTADDMYPIREIEQTFNGRRPELPPDEKEIMAAGMRRNLVGFVQVAEQNILWRVSGNYQMLADLAQSYPDTNLGRQAAERLAELDAGRTGVLSVMSDEAFETPYDEGAAAAVAAAGPTEAEAVPAAVEGAGASPTTPFGLAAAVAAAVVAMALAAMAIARLRRRPRGPASP